MSKYRLYVDEVGNSDLGSSNNENHRFLSLTGVAINLEYVMNTIYPELESLKTKFFNSHPDEPIILHRKELVRKKPPFSSLQIPEIENEFNSDLLSLLNKWTFTIFTVIIDKKEHNVNYNNTWKYDPYHYCQEVLVERFKLFLSINEAKGDIMFESRGGKEDMRLKKSFSTLITNGTHFITPNELCMVLTSKQLKIKPKRANIAGLQIADLIAHPLRRWCFKNFFDNHEKHSTFGDKIIEISEPKIFKYNGRIKGYGMKKLP